MGLRLETCLNQRAGPTQLTRNLTSSYCFCDPFSRGPVHPALISFSFNNKKCFLSLLPSWIAFPGQDKH